MAVRDGSPATPGPGEGDAIEPVKPAKRGRGAAERDSHGRREEVLDAALKIFAINGYRATTMEDIARELDFTPAALYYYFKSKQSLLALIVSRPVDAMMEQAAAIDASDDSPIDKVRAAIGGHVRLITERQEWFSVMLREQIELPAEQIEVVNAKNREYRKFLTHLIDDAVKDGSLAGTNSSVVSLIVIGAINWTLQWWHNDGVLAPDEVASILVTLVLDGLRPRDAK
jgi:AcrR family transcriptional regulator